MQSIFFNETCLATNYDGVIWSVFGFPCPVQNTSDYMNILTAGWRTESQVGTQWSVLLLAILMQVGGIPAPVKKSYFSSGSWVLWMLAAFMQFVIILLSLLFIPVSYHRMATVVGPCMVEGFWGVSLLGIVMTGSCIFQPIVLSKLLAMLLYYYSITAGFQVYRKVRRSLAALPTLCSPHPNSGMVTALWARLSCTAGEKRRVRAEGKHARTDRETD